MCEHTNAKCVESTDVKDEGRFVEHYECETCGSTGVIAGNEEDAPNEWDRYGQVFR